MKNRNSTRDRRNCFEAHKHGDPVRLSCYVCKTVMDPVRDRWEAEHVTPFVHGGTDVRPICIPCHREKTPGDISRIAKGKRQRNKNYGIKKSSRPFRGWRNFRGEPVWNTRGK